MSPQVQAVLDMVAAEWKIPVDLLLARGNQRRRALPRQVAAMLCRVALGKSYEAVGKAVHRHHTTVIYAVNVLQARRGEDPALDARISRLEEDLGGVIEALKPRPFVAEAFVEAKRQVMRRARWEPMHRDIPRKPRAVRPPVKAVDLAADSPVETVTRPSLPFDGSELPAAGTACAWCRERRHFCPAKGFAGDVPVCLECGDGTPCGVEKAIERMRHGYRMGEAA